MTSANVNAKAYQRIVDHVQDAIAAGELRPGDRLPSERDLVARFGVARSSVREALRVLESRDLVRSRPGDPRGPLVQPITVEPVRRSLALLTTTGGLDLPELIQFRMIVDSFANLTVAARRTDEQLVALERNMARMRGAMARGYAEFSRADLEFHEILADAAGNRLVQVYGEVTREAVASLIERTIADAADRSALMLQSLRHHAAVFDAISDRDGLRASRLARESLYAYYAEYVPEPDRAVLADLVREVGGTLR